MSASYTKRPYKTKKACKVSIYECFSLSAKYWSILKRGGRLNDKWCAT